MASPKIGTPESKARHDGTAGRHLQSGVRSEEEPWLRERPVKRETIQILCGQFVHWLREKVVNNFWFAQTAWLVFRYPSQPR
jgi:hypothetical protein